MMVAEKLKQAKEATDKELSIIKEKVITLIKKQNNDQAALNKLHTVSFDYEYFIGRNSACKTVDCFNHLFEELQKWNQQDK